MDPYPPRQSEELWPSQRWNLSKSLGEGGPKLDACRNPKDDLKQRRPLMICGSLKWHQRHLDMIENDWIWFTMIKGSWEAILPRYGQIEFWVLKWWRVVRDWHLTLKGWCAIETWPWRVVRDWERVVRDWHLTLKGGVKGGVRLRLDLEGWCAIETWPWRVVRDWERVVRDWHLTLKGGVRLRLDLEGWCAIETWPWRVVCDWDLILKGGVRLRLDLEGWCAIETWPWRVVWDFTWPWWRVVADRIETWPWRVLRDWDLTLKGGVRLRLDLDEGWLQIAL